MHHRITYFLLLSLFSLQCLFVTGQSLRFKHFKEADGLPPSTVLCLLQDQLGFLWIGTTDGLYRYDGIQFKEFRHDRRNASSLSNNYIKALHEGKNGNLWIATKRGLNCYSPKLETFQTYFYSSDSTRFEEENYIHSVIEDQRGFIWYSSYNGLFRIDLAKDSIMQFLPDLENQNSIGHRLIWSVFEDQEGRIWLGHRKGLCLYQNDGSFQFQCFTPDANNPNAIQNEQIWEFTQQPNGTIWFGSDHGLYKVIEQEGNISFRHFPYRPKETNSLSDPFINSIYSNDDNRIWVGTWQGGLNEILTPHHDTTALRFIHHPSDADKEHSISSNRIHDILQDRTGNLWVATTSGLDQFAPSNQKFTAITTKLNQGLSHNIIRSVLKDQFGNLWVGTFDGLNFLSAQNYANNRFEFIHFKHNPNHENSLVNNNIRCLYEDHRGFLWIGTDKGLHYLNLAPFEYSTPKPQKVSFGHFSFSDGLPHHIINDIRQDTSGMYWIATFAQLSRMTFDPSSPSKTQFQNYKMSSERSDALSNETTYLIEEDRFGQMWIGTFNGLSKLQNEEGEGSFENYKRKDSVPNGISDNSITDILLDRDGSLWIGTRGGLNLVQQQSNHHPAQFRSFGIAEGLPNDVIQSIEQDKSGNLWLGTNRGLIHFSTTLAKRGLPPVLNTYTAQDGLAGSFQVGRASFADEDGRLLFGGAAGLNIFDPNNLIKNTVQPNIVLTELYIANQIVKPQKTPDAILRQAFSLTKKITLDYFQNNIDIHFAALDFTWPQKNQYAYQLEGVDEEWVYIGNQHSARFNYLSPGTYQFKIKAANNDGQWSETPRVLEIVVLSPPWLSWWAYCIYALLFGSLLYGIYQFRLRRKIRTIQEKAQIEKARFEEREHLRKQNAADFHDELGHRLTKIALFLELAKRQPEASEELKANLEKIKQNTTGLSTGIRDLIWTLDPEKDSLFQTLLRLQSFGDSLFEASEINFLTKGLDPSFESLQLAPNIRKHLLLIFKEAMNNALKYSNANQVIFEVRLEKDDFILSLRDDGKGFKLDQPMKGYGLQNMKQRAQKIRASWHLESTKGIGTTIRLRFKMPQMG